MKTKDYLKILKDEIHSTVFATVDSQGLPVARVIDIMLADDNSLYFITAKGKGFYQQLIDKKYVAVSGMTGGADSLSKKAISIRGNVKNIGSKKLKDVFEENPYMAEIYPDEDSRIALDVFQIYEGQGEFFDLSTKPITRKTFYLGESQEENKRNSGYFITDLCHGCRICYSKCPQKCIDLSVKPFVINQDHCLHCGNCISVCPFGAVEKR
jgi:uncharacterized pyridoxamine 5'-phosphate oxidase family protein/Pyruvate/2-oxoacid:ferredoxin oxidoreductase delta subunit